MLRRLQILGLVVILFLGAMLPLGVYLWKPDNSGPAYPPDKVPAYLKSYETAQQWAREQYAEYTAKRLGLPANADAAAER